MQSRAESILLHLASQANKHKVAGRKLSESISTSLKIRLPHLVKLLGYPACIILITAILYWRRPDAFYNPQFWAEDGEVFFTDAFFLGIQSLFIPYRGYYHTIARIVAWGGSWMPPQQAPLWYGFVSWVLLIVIVRYLFSSRFQFTNSLRFLLGLALVTSTADNEVFFNLANWATLTTFFWLLLAISEKPQTNSQIAFDRIVLLLTGLNSPFSICLWPMFILRWRIQKTTSSLYLLLLSIIVVFVQVWHMPSRILTGSMFPTINLSYADIFVYRLGYMFFGEQVYQLQLTDPLRIYGLIIVAAFYGSLLWHGARTKNWALIIILGGGMMATSLSMYVMRDAPPSTLAFWAGRHYYIPAVTTIWALLLSNLRPRYMRLIPLSMIFIAFLIFTPNHKNETRPDLDWSGHVEKCTGLKIECKIPINPIWEPLRWFALMDSHVFTVPELQYPFSSTFDDKIEFLGYELSQTDHHITIAWKTRREMEKDYKFFIHLLSLENKEHIVAQIDSMPLAWNYPTSRWVMNEIVVDEISLPTDSLSVGEYNVHIGWYDPDSPTLERLMAYDDRGQNWDSNTIKLPTILIVR